MTRERNGIEKLRSEHKRWDRWTKEVGFWMLLSVVETIYSISKFKFIRPVASISIGFSFILILFFLVLNKKRIDARNNLVVSEVMET